VSKWCASWSQGFQQTGKQVLLGSQCDERISTGEDAVDELRVAYDLGDSEGRWVQL
jgi:hypothetical protein